MHLGEISAINRDRTTGFASRSLRFPDAWGPALSDSIELTGRKTLTEHSDSIVPPLFSHHVHVLAPLLIRDRSYRKRAFHTIAFALTTI